MNPGTFGISNGSTVGGRLVRRSPPSAYQLIGSVSNVILTSGITTPISYTPSAGVRTRVFSLICKGYLKLAAICDEAGAAGASITSELYIDGVKVCNATLASTTGTAGSGHVLVGGVGNAAPPYPAVVTLEYVPFQSSVELYVTRSTAGNTSYSVAYDIYE